jgi:diguanylate cyclase (GGDEF)-like protein
VWLDPRSDLSIQVALPSSRRGWGVGPNRPDREESRLVSVLVIDDSASARSEIRAVLEGSCLFGRILEAVDGLAGLRMLLAETVDAVVCDLEMPGLDGEKLLRAQRSRPDGQDVPFFFLTAQRDPDRMARLLRAGASDTIQKPFHPAELIARLETHLRVRRLQAELRDKNAMLERISTTDAVTGMRTRRYIGELLSIEVLRASRYHTPLAVAMCDLDHFKRVNDSFGHPAGDAVLAGVSDVMRRTLRTTDAAGRYGGEEFLLVLPGTDIAGALALAERVRAAIEETGFDVGVEAPYPVTVSVGVAALGDGESVEALVRAADEALYEAKAAGRNRVVVAGETQRALDSAEGKTRPALGARRPR